MKIFQLCCLSLLLSLMLSACQPQAVNQVAQQQHQICKSLIEGFLKIQQLGNYQLASVSPDLHATAQNRRYTFQTSMDQMVRISVPTQQDLAFECKQKQAGHFEVQLLNKQRNQMQRILSLKLPESQAIDTLTAFALKNQ